jgi:hypothetical protein
LSRLAELLRGRVGWNVVRVGSLSWRHGDRLDSWRIQRDHIILKWERRQIARQERTALIVTFLRVIVLLLHFLSITG